MYRARAGGLFSGREAANPREFLEAIQCMIYLTEHSALAGVPIKTAKEMRERVLALQDHMRMSLRDLVTGANPQLSEIVMAVDRNLNDKCDEYRSIILPLSRAEKPGLAEELSRLLNKKPQANNAPAAAGPNPQPAPNNLPCCPIVVLGYPDAESPKNSPR